MPGLLSICWGHRFRTLSLVIFRWKLSCLWSFSDRRQFVRLASGTATRDKQDNSRGAELMNECLQQELERARE